MGLERTVMYVVTDSDPDAGLESKPDKYQIFETQTCERHNPTPRQIRKAELLPSSFTTSTGR